MEPPVTLAATLGATTLEPGCLDNPEAVIVVAIRRPVPVAVRTMQIPRISVPGATAHDGPRFDRLPARSHPLEHHPGQYLLQQGVAVGGSLKKQRHTPCHAARPPSCCAQSQHPENDCGMV